MAGSDKRKQSLYFPEDMLKEIQDEATRQDRSLSWIVQKAWKIARKEIMKYPSVNEFPGEEDERGAKLFFSGKTLFLPKTAAGIVRELDSAGTTTIQSLQKHDENALKIVRRLIQEGFAIQSEPENAAEEGQVA